MKIAINTDTDTDTDMDTDADTDTDIDTHTHINTLECDKYRHGTVHVRTCTHTSHTKNEKNQTFY